MSDIVKLVTRLLAILTLPVLIGLGTFLFLKSAFLEAPDASKPQPVRVEIPKDKNFRDICHELQSRGIIRYWWSLDLIARFKKTDTRKVSAGEYELSTAMKPADVLTKLVNGDVVKRTVLVKEGMSVWEIGQAVEDAGLITKADFNRAVVDRALLETFRLQTNSFEGYLFPDTYVFSRPTDAEAIIRKMVIEGEKRWPPEFTDQADKISMTRHDILTLASIIEKESGNKDEQPLISSVFHNRLKQGMKLQSDPTVVYGIPNFSGSLTKADLTTPTPYNTYVNFGLPPGPICNPGETALRAALFPRETQYLYFVADGRGSHVFSTTLTEHNEAVARFILNKK